MEELPALPTEPLARKEAARLMAELPAHAVLPLDKLGGVPLAGAVAKKKSRGLLPRLLSRRAHSPRGTDTTHRKATIPSHLQAICTW